MKFAEIENWITDVVKLTNPKEVVWCNGSQEEHNNALAAMAKRGEILPITAPGYKNCHLYRSHPSDVARTEHKTYVCTNTPEAAGPNNNWLDPDKAHAKVDRVFRNCMQGRTMYVIPYCMGPIDSPHSGLGIELTDSLYVVANMFIMTRIGDKALEKIKTNKFDVVRGLHSTADLDPDKRYIMHFPEKLLIKSIGSGYGGNALLGKKCHALRLASWQAKHGGWLAEHMLIAGIEHAGKTHYVAAAFPSACGKTNLAMLIPPEKHRDYKIWTVGDDIAWLRLGEDGRMWAMNPESGYFGVVPGTNENTNPIANDMLNHDAIFTNVALTSEGEPWWEGKTKGKPQIDWRGDPWGGVGTAAHPNARFTVSAKHCPTYSPAAEDPQGVPLSAIIFGGRRSTLNPLVAEAFDWTHGIFMGATLASETTAAITGQVGTLRRDPMAMLPFCGYNMGDYWQHWLSFQDKSQNLPRIFQVNWFQKNAQGKFAWPGFGDNIRVLKWIVERCENKVDAQHTPIGNLPNIDDIDFDGVSDADRDQLLAVVKKDWLEELDDLDDHFGKYGSHTPPQFKVLQERMRKEFTTTDEQAG
ncbi:MAG: phosphoenolpyruvate carboxykinase (GTP) [Pseudomonadota bacterium]|nr:phosphoenolpyruvate carboxykinase (GTP) [Pseudomonadota bacterium]